MKCPILMLGLIINGIDFRDVRGECLKEKCMFYRGNSFLCEVTVFSNRLNQLTKAVEDLEDKLNDITYVG